MSDTSEDSSASSNLPEFSVSEISQALKRTVEETYSWVRVRGEISQPKLAGSGHMYMTLKDDRAVLDGVCWRGTVNRLSIRPEEGLEVIVTGKLTTYPGRSKYQIVIEAMELAGEGALLKLLEERRRKLAAEGLFDEDRKQELPFLPGVIGVVTSPTGAVIRDILHRLADRFPRHVLVWPVRVQGDGAAEEIANAIRGFNALEVDGPVPRPDLLIVARGGGSLEDLWAFNEEIVVRAAAGSNIALISAVGHETDTTLIDFASDRRAPTPTAAAEIAVPVRSELLAQIVDDSRRLDQAVLRRVADGRQRIDGLARGLPKPLRIWEEMAQKLDERHERLRRAWIVRHDRFAQKVLGLDAGLISPRQRVQAAQKLFESLAARVSDRVLRDRLQSAEEQIARCWRDIGRDARIRTKDLGDRLVRVAGLLEAYSHQGVLDRGFALIRDAVEGTPLLRASCVSIGQSLSIEFGDGRVAATAGEQSGGGPPTKPRAKPAAKQQALAPKSQGSLFD